MPWIIETTITLNPLSLGVIILGGIALGWTIYALRGYKYWLKRFHHYNLPRTRRMKKNYGYVEYVPGVANMNARQLPRYQGPQVIQKNALPPLINRKTQNNESQVNYSTKDNLQVIEGIGPKIEVILNTNGVYTWRELANTPISNLQNILERAGNRFKMHDPNSWPEQAIMAHTGKWDDLRKWQDELHKGIEIRKI
jgi:predicted flap endonuclease-1-like 5' DNA nuclease